MKDYIIVNYHYIRPQKLKGLNPCTEEQFETQLDYLRTNYAMGSVEEVYRAAKTGKPGRFCALTFDDGLKEHYRFVFPRLARHKIRGAFFLSGEVLRDKKVSLTHKLHVLLLYAETASLVALFREFFKNRYRIDAVTRLNPRRRFDDILTANLKETLIALPLAERADFINHAFGVEHDEKKIAEEFFLNPDEAKAMDAGGMEIGAHGFRHLSLEVLNESEQREDISKSKAALKELVGVTPEIFSYPHGRATETTLAILKEDGFRYGVSIKAEDISPLTDPFFIPRYDTNDLSLVMQGI